MGEVNNLTFEALCKSFSSNIQILKVVVYPIISDFCNRIENKNQKREQNIVIGHNKMLKYLSYNNAEMCRIDRLIK